MCEINQKMFFEVKGEYFSLGLNHGEILLYAMIKNYNQHNQQFTASNEYLSTLFDVSERTIRMWIKDLKDRNLISVKIVKNNGNIIRLVSGN